MKLAMLFVTKDDDGQPIDPPKLFVDDQLLTGYEDDNGWLFHIDLPDRERVPA